MFEFIKKDIYFYIILILSICFFYIVRGILFPFVVAIIVAFLFKNLVKKAENIKINRNVSSLFFVFVSYLLFTLAIIFVVPLLFNQIISLIKELLNYFNKIDIKATLSKFEYFELIQNNVDIESNINLIYQHCIKFLGNFSNFLLSKSVHMLNLVLNLIVSPIISFYILRDWDKIFLCIKNILPSEQKDKIVDLAKKINEVLEGFCIGQFLVCLILGIYYSTMLYFADLKYGLLIGIFSGLCTVIPYLGCINGCIISIIASIFQYGCFDTLNVLLIIVIFSLGQFFEGNFITPRFIGEKINLHPLWVMFAMFAGGYLFGLTGIFFSLPIAGTIGAIIRFFLENNSNN